MRTFSRRRREFRRPWFGGGVRHLSRAVQSVTRPLVRRAFEADTLPNCRVDALERRIVFATDLSFEALRPLSGRVYGADATAFVSTAGEAQDFTFTLPVAQRVAVQVAPPEASGGTLRSSVRVLGADEITVYGESTATSAGAAATLQPIALAAGTYVVRVEGAAGTTGAFTMQARLNAAFEAEPAGGATNNTTATATPLNAAGAPGTILLQGGGRLASVVGQADGSGRADVYRVELAAGQSLAALLGTAGGGYGQFGDGQVSAGLAGTNTIVPADMNDDGRIDLVVSSLGQEGGPTLSVLLDQGDGTYLREDWSLGGGISEFVVDDFNVDGYLDVAAVRPGWYYSFSPEEYDYSELVVFFGAGDGTSDGSFNTSLYDSPHAIAAGDFNGDGVPDLALGHYPATIYDDFGNELDPGGFVSTFRNDGDGFFVDQRRFTTGGRVYDLKAADFDGDGIDDLVVAEGDYTDQSGRLSLIGMSADFPGLPASYRSFGADVPFVNVAVGDLNNDGNLDLVGLRYYESSGSADVWLLDADGNPTLGYGQQLTPLPFAREAHVALADLNRDGYLDVAVSAFSDYDAQEQVFVNLNDRSGFFFAGGFSYDTDTQTRTFAFADLNGDGDLDLIAAAEESYYDEDAEEYASELTIFPGRGTAEVELLDAAGTVVAKSTWGGFDADAAIADFVSASGGTYYLRVRGDLGTRYQLATTIGARLGLEPEVVDNHAQELTLANGQAAARIGFSGEIDEFTIGLAAGDAITVTAIARGNGDAPANLGLIVELVAANGSVLASDTAGNATATFGFTVATAGTYKVRVRAAAGSGDYDVRITGGTGAAAPMTIVGRSPGVDETVPYRPVVFVDFSLPVLIASLDPGDLLINGTPATSVTAYDGDSVYFSDARLDVDGVYTVSIADGAILSTDGRSLVGATWSFTVDANGPRVVNSSLVEGEVRAPGPLQWDVGFNEKLLQIVSLGMFAQIILDPGDVVLTNRSTNQREYTSRMDQDDYNVGLDYNFYWDYDLPEGAYEARLLSNLSGFQDLGRRLLDGEPNGSFPSGDGNPGGDYYVNFVVDAPGITELPPMQLAGPKASLIHETSTARAFHAAGDLDSFTIDLDAAQRITVLLEPTEGSNASSQLELFDPSGTRLAIGSGNAGDPVVLELVAGTTGGTYRIDAKSLSGIAGYTLRVIVNAAVDADLVGGINDTRATAQPLVLHPLVGGFGGERGGVVGRLSVEDVPDASIKTAATRNANLGSNASRALGVSVTSGDDVDFYRVDLAAGQVLSVALSGAGTGASLVLTDASGTALTSGAGGSANFGLGIVDFIAPAAGAYYVIVDGAGDYGLVVTRNASIERAAISPAVPEQDLTRTGQILGHVDRGGLATSPVRVAYVGQDTPSTPSGNNDPNRLINQLNDDTFRNFTAVRVGSADVDTFAELSQYDVIVIGVDANLGRAGFANALRNWVEAGGSLVVTGYAIANVHGYGALRDIMPVTTTGSYTTYSGGTIVPTGIAHPVIDNVGTAAINATHLYAGAAVSGATTLATVNGRPAVVVRDVGSAGRVVFLSPDYGDRFTGDATLRTAAGDRLLEQAVAWAGGSGDRLDGYAISLTSGDVLTLTTANPNGDTAQPVNLIDPILELYAPNGTLAATNDNGLDGRNARIVYTVPAGAGGIWRVVVRAANLEGGTYVVNASGQTGAPVGTGVSVIATSPQDGKTFASPPSTIEFTLSANVLAASVQASDLTLSSGVATDVQIVDGRTIRFSVSGATAQGTYTYSLAPGAFTDLQGNPSVAYVGSYTLDTTGPRVVSVTPTQASAPFTGWTVTFSEAIDAGTFTSSDIVSLTGPSGTSVFLSSITVVGNTATISILPRSVSGTYTVTFGPNIADLYGNLMDQDEDGTRGESVQDRYTASTVVASPNLVVENVQVVGAAVYGQSVTVRWTVRNAGSDPASGSWSDRLVLSTDTTYDTSDRVLATLPALTTPLAAGATYTREHTFNLPLDVNVTPGSLRFVVETDYNRQQLESNDADNTGASAATNVALPPLPDLAVTNVELIEPADPRSGSPATIRWTLTNVGTAAASGVIRDEFYLSTDAVVGGDTSIGGADYSVNLAAGASVVRTAIVNLPINQFGTRHVVVKTDASNVVFEHTNEANNAALSGPVTITLPPLVDLVVTDIIAPATVTSGTSPTITWTLANTGTSDWSGTISEVISLSADDVIGGDVEYRTVSFTGTIAAGSSIQRSETINLPIALSGSYRVVVRTDATNAVFEDTGETNNTTIDDQPMVVSLPATPDLVVTNITAPATSLSGRLAPVAWTLRNDGTASFTGTFRENVYLSADDAIGNDLFMGQFTFTGTLAPGQEVTRQQSITLANVFSGTFRVVVITDVNDNVFENTGESNNATIDDQTIVVTQAPYANLGVENVIAPPTAASSETIELTWTVRNRGDASTNASAWFDAVYLSTDATFGGTDTRIARFGNASYLNAGEAYQRTEIVTLPQGLQGTYYLIVVTDETNTVFEYVPAGSAETDNTAASGAINVSLTPPPDLRVTSVVGPVVAFSGNTSMVSWTVANLGGGATRPGETRWTDLIYLSNDATFSGDDELLGDLRHDGGLAAGGSYSASANVRLPIGISGDYYFIVRTDAFNNVFEAAFEGNNVTAETSPTNVRLTPPPDLTVASITAPNAATAGRTLSVQYRVNNDGASATVEPSWTDRYYLSTAATFDVANATQIGAQARYGSVAAGQGYDVSIGLAVPRTLAEGNYYLYVVTDADGKVFEVDNANNVGRRAGTIEVTRRFADLQIAAFSPPEMAAAGTAVPFGWTVTNAGTGDTIATRWFDRVVLSIDNVLGNGDDVYLTQVERNAGLLAPGASYAQSVSLAISASVAPGVYNVFFQTDSGNAVFESDETNNTNAAAPPTMTIVRTLPDLQVSAVTTPASAAGGSSVPVSFTIRNAGGATTNAGSWNDEIWLSSDTTIGSSDVRLRVIQRSGTLAPDGTYTVDTSVTLPNDLVGTYYLIVRTDSTDRVIETPLEGNNDRASSAITVTPRQSADLVTTSVVAPAEAYGGQQTAVTWTVRNDGSARAPEYWYDTVYLSPDRVFDTGDVALASVRRDGGLNAGESYTATRNVKLPAGASGPYYVIVVTDSSDRLYESGLASNNTGVAAAATNVVLAPPADLVAGTILVPINGSPGQSASVTYTVTNNSTQPALGRWTDSLFLSADAEWDINDKLFGRREHVGDVEAGESYTHTVTAAMPGVTPGEYYLIVRSDIGNQVPESDEANNLIASLDRVLLDVPALALGTPAGGTLSPNGGVYYRVDVAAGETLLVDFDAATTSGSTQLFVKYGDVPTRADFDFGYDRPLSADQKIIVPKTRAGTYYILAYGDGLAANTAYEIVARTLEFEVVNDDFGVGGNAGNLTIEVDGSQFDRTVLATLVADDGSTRTAKQMWYRTSTQLYATFDLSGLAAGSYDVRFSKAGELDFVVADGLAVVANTRVAETKPTIYAPAGTGPNALFQFGVAWGNDGLNDVAAPLLVVGSSNGTVSFVPDGSQSPSFTFYGGSQDDGPVGIFRPGQTARRDLYARNGGNGTALELFADRLGTNRARVFDWARERDMLAAATDLDAADFARVFAQLVADVGPTWGHYLDALGESASLIPIRLGNHRVAQSILHLNVLRATAKVFTSMTGRAVLPDLDVPIDNRDVIATNRATGESFVTISLNDGSFIFERLAPGTYDLTFDGAAIVSGGSFTVADGQHLTGHVLTLKRGSTLGGTVRDDANRPIAGASVNAYNDVGLTAQVTTDDSGAYLLAGLSPGNWTIYVDAPGRARGVIAGVELAADSDLSGRNFSLVARSRAIGSVASAVGPDTRLVVTARAINADGQPVRGGAAYSFVATLTGSAFDLAELPAGRYELGVFRSGYVPQFRTFEVAQGQQIDLGTIGLARGATVGGTVSTTDPTFNVAFVSVGLYQGETLIAATPAFSLGSFTFEDVPAGTYSVRPMVAGQFFDPVTVTVTTGAQISGLNIVVRPGGSIAGTVRTTLGGAVVGGEVTLWDAAGNRIASRQADASGNYRFDGLARGDYSVRATNTAVPVTVTSLDAAPAASANITLPVAGVISGTLRDAAGRPIAGAVRIIQNGRQVGASLANAQGRYQLILAVAGTFDLVPESNLGSFAPLTNLTLSAGSSLVRDFTSGSSTLNVTLGGGAFTGGFASLLRIENGLRIEAGGDLSIASSGVLTFRNLRPGNYELRVRGPVGSNVGARQAITVGSGTTAAAVTLTAEATIRGTITNAADGAAIAGSRLFLVDSAAPADAGAYQTVTGIGGAYSFVNVRPGTYDLYIVADGFALATRTGVVVNSDGSTVVVDTPLTASAAQITGRAVDGAGQPVRAGGSVIVTTADGRIVLGTSEIAADGTFAVHGPSGTGLRVEIVAPGAATATLNVDVAAGASVAVGDVVMPTVSYGVGVLPTGGTVTSPTSAGVALSLSRPVLRVAAPVAVNGVGPGSVALPLPTAALFTELPGWYWEIKGAIDGVQRSGAEVTRGDVPPLDKCKTCAGAQAAVFHNIDLTQARWDMVREYRDSLEQDLWDIGKAFALDVARVGGILAGLVLTMEAIAAGVAIAGGVGAGVVAIEGGLGLGVASTGLNLTFAFAQVSSAIYLLVDQAQDIARQGGIKGTLNQIQTASGQALSASNILSAMLSVVMEITKDVGLIAYSSARGAVAGVLDWIINAQGIIDTLSFKLMFDIVKQAEAKIEQLKTVEQRYLKQVVATYKSLSGYKRCLANASEECDPNDPLPPDEPGPDAPVSVPVFASRDPNDIIGPVGYGPQSFIRAASPLEYTIRFENAADATAPARRVTITQTLDSDLDARTFRLGDFGFSGLFFDVPEDTSFYQTRLDLRETMGIYLDVIAGIDVSSGQAFWEFISVDPATGDVPTNPLLGFLPINTTSPEGEGFVKYAVRARAGVITGTVIDAIASIVFDANPPIETPPIFNTLDAVAASSSVRTIAGPTGENTTDITLGWGGDDDEGGSAVASYDVYVAIDGKPFTLWLDDATVTEAVYRGEAGRRYAFYTRANDNAGNVEEAPDVADVSISLPGGNLAPELGGLPDSLAVDEGSPLTLAGSASDPNLGDVLTLEADYDDGLGFRSITLASDGTFALATSYRDNGARQITLRLTDQVGGTVTRTIAVRVDNVAPTLPPINNATIASDGTGATFTQTLLASDAGDDVLTGEVDYGQGFTPVTIAADGSFTLDHRFAAPGTYAVSVRVTDDDGGVILRTFNVTVLPPASVVTGVTVNDGGVQRSTVTKLTIAFDASLALTNDMLKLYRRDGSGGRSLVSDVGLVLTPVGTDGRTWQVTFTGTGAIGGSLGDGVYELDISGETLAPSTFAFYRLFGDANGDRVVDRADELLFRTSYRTSLGQPGFNAAFDYDGNGVIDRADELAFRSRYRTSITF